MGTGQTSACCHVDPCGDSVAVDLDLPGHRWQQPRKWWAAPLLFASQSFSIGANSTVVPRCAVAAILLVAALLKLDALRLDLSLRGERLWADWWTLLAIEWEFLLGAALLLGIALRTTWVVVLGTFVCFLAFAIWLIVTGASNCGCFGRLEFDPRWTAVLDAVVIVAAFRCVRIADPHPDRSVGRVLASAKLARRCYGVIGLIAVGILGYVALESPLSVEAGQVPGITEIRPDVELWEPDKWIGNSLPIMAQTNIADTLSVGRWQLFLVRSSCSHGREVIATRLHPMSRNDIAIIDLDTNSTPSHEWSELLEGGVLVGSLRVPKMVFAQVPFEITLDHRKVVAAQFQRQD